MSATAPQTRPSLDARQVNVAARLTAMARAMPAAVAIAQPLGRSKGTGNRPYRTITFAELDADSGRLAEALRQLGVVPGTRLALLVPPSIEFVTLVFALLRSGAVSMLIDPGMGRRNLVGCLADAQPEGFVAIPLVHAVRQLLGRRFPDARHNVAVGGTWAGGMPLDRLRQLAGDTTYSAPTTADDPAAIIFTTGSTGPPKGVLYRHETFDAQARQIRDFYDIRPGEVDLPGFPLFGLFNCAMGVTTILPDMDPTRPARVDPPRIIEAIRQWNVTQAFGSPAMLRRIGEYCQEHGERLPSVRRVLSAGAPVPPRVLEQMTATIDPDGQMHTPYGATEALPVASISAREVLDETAARSAQGAGTCLGRRFPEVRWQVIRIADGPIASIDQIEPLATGEIGELIVAGPQVTREYATRREANALAKIVDGEVVWHRMGDVGYLDADERFWFCGRMAHRVRTRGGTLFTVPCEAIYNAHADVFRTALVGVGPIDQQQPVIVVEPLAGHWPRGAEAKQKLIAELRELGRANSLTESIDRFLLHRSFPVDIRHNSKIFREKLARWAARRV